MSQDLMAHFLNIVPIGFFSGLLAGAFGIGGGVVSVPLVRLFIGVPAHVAVGSTLAVILPTAIIGALNYLKNGKLIPKLAFVCAGPAAISTIAASAASSYIQGRYLMLMLAALMTLVGIDFAIGISTKLRAASPSTDEDKIENLKLDNHELIQASVIGIIVGLLSGMLGIGGGFIMVPAFCYLLKLPLKVAFGTSLIVVALVSLPGTVVHALDNHVYLWIVLPMIAGSLPGAWLGSHLSLKTKDRHLRVTFGIILLVMSIAFAYREMIAN